MKPKVAFLTTIFPMERQYILDFFNSLSRQTYAGFDVIVVNDGYEDFAETRNVYNNLSIVEIKSQKTPAKNRELGIEFVKNNNYDILIFGDSDDYFSDNRVQVTIELLHTYSIVVNDLTLFNRFTTLQNKYISKRYSNCTLITLDDIKNKNIFGLSNTAVRVNELDDCRFDTRLIAVDWYLFSILLLKKRSAIFTNDTLTFYRQHGLNTIGMGEITKASLHKEVLVKKIHYSLLSKVDDQYKALLEGVRQIEGRLNNINEFEINYLKNSCFNFLWWETTACIGEKSEAN
jgi:glycosyltransferase involved in cell wall biosynthesis